MRREFAEIAVDVYTVSILTPSEKGMRRRSPGRSPARFCFNPHPLREGDAPRAAMASMGWMKRVSILTPSEKGMRRELQDLLAGYSQRFNPHPLREGDAPGIPAGYSLVIIDVSILTPSEKGMRHPTVSGLNGP